MQLRIVFAVSVAILIALGGCDRNYKPKRLSKTQREARFKKLISGLRGDARSDERPFGGRRGLGLRPRKQHPPEPPEQPVDAESKKYLGYGTKVNVPRLIELLDHKNPAVREGALRKFALEDQTPPRAMPKVIALLNDKSSGVRAQAANLLSKFGKAAKAAIPQLILLLGHHRYPVVSSSAKALQSMGELAEPHIPKFIEAFQKEDCASHGSVAQLLGSFGPKARAALPSLAQKVNQRWGGTTYAEAIGRIGGVNELLTGLSSRNEWSRASAAYGIGYLNPTPRSAVAALLAARDDGSKDVRERVAQSLGKVRPTTEQVVAALGKLIADKDDSVQKEAAKSLGEIDPKLDSAVKPLLAATSSRHDAVRQAATESLARFKTSLRPRVLAAVRVFDRDRWNARKVLEKEPKKTLPILLDIVRGKSQPRKMRMNATLAMAVYKIRDVDSKAVQAEVKKLLESEAEHPDVRFFAAAALSDMWVSHPAIHKTFVETLEKTSDSYVRRIAAERADSVASSKDAALVQRAANALLSNLRSRDSDLVEAVCDSLADFKEKAVPAVPQLCRIVANTSGKNRDDAAKLLGRIDPSGKQSIPVMLAAIDQKNSPYGVTDAIRSIILRVRENARGKPQYEFDIRPIISQSRRWLRDSNSLKHDDAAKLLGALGRDAAVAVPDMLPILKQKYQYDQAYVIRALGEIGPSARDAIPKLMGYAKDASDKRYLDSFRALCAMRPPVDDFMPLLTAGLNQDNTRKAALEAVAGYGAEAERSIPAIASLIETGSDSARTDAMKVAPAFGAKSVRLLPALRKALTDKSDSIRVAALNAIGELGKHGKAAIPDLQAVMEKGRSYRRTPLAAANALMKIAPNRPEVLVGLLRHVNTNDESNRYTQLFREMGKKAEPILKRALASKDAQTREKALALTKLSLPERDYTAMLLTSLKNKDAPYREQAAIALNNKGGLLRETTPVLIASLRRADEKKNWPLDAALRHAGRLAVPGLVDILLDPKAGPYARQRAGDILRGMATTISAAAPRLSKALGSNDPVAKTHAAFILARIPGDKSNVLPVLLEALKSDDKRIHALAINSLAQPRFKDRAEQFRPALIAALRHKEREVRSAAAYSLQHHGVRDADISTLREIFTENKVSRSNVLNAVSSYPQPAAGALPLFVAALRGNDEDLYDTAADTLKRYGPPGIAALIKAAADSKAPMKARRQALYSLDWNAKLRDADTKALIALLKDKQPQIQILAAATLGRHGETSPDMLKLLLAGLRSDEYEVRIGSSSALERLGAKARTILPELKKLLNAEKSSIRSTVASLYASIGKVDPDAAATLMKLVESEPRVYRRRILGRDVGAMGTVAVPALLAALKGTNSRTRRAALSGFEAMGMPKAAGAIPTIKALAADRDRETALWAASTLAALDKQAAAEFVPVLIRGLESFDRDARERAFRGLQPLGPAAAPAVPKLIELAGKDSRSRYQIMGTLRSIGPKAKTAVPLLMEQFRDGRADYSAAQALAAIGPGAGAAVPELLKLLHNDRKMDYAAMILSKAAPEKGAAETVKLLDDEILKDRAVRVVGRFGERAAPAVPKLLALWKSEDDTGRLSIHRALGLIGPPAKSAVPLLLGVAKSGNPGQQSSALYALAGIQSNPAQLVPVAIRLAESSKDLGVRRAAIFALRKSESASRPAVELLTRLLDDEQLRYDAMNALGAIGGASRPAVERIAGFLKDNSSYRRRTVVRVLGEIGPNAAAAVPRLVAVLKDAGSDSLRAEAAKALWQIDPAAAKNAGAPKPKETPKSKN